MGSQKNLKMVCRSAAASPSVQELISQLHSSFFATEFQNVAKTLVEREEKMKDKCIEWGKKAEAVEREKDLLFLENLKLKDELKKKQKEFDELRKVNLEYKDHINGLNLKERNASKNLVADDELKKKQSEIDAMRKVNVEYERTIGVLKMEKSRTEAEIRAYKKHFLELGDRGLSLESTSKALIGSEGTFPIEVGNEPQKNASAAESGRALLFGEEGDSKKRTESKFPEIIQIDDDDEERISTLKRRRVSNEINREHNVDDDDKMPTETQKRKNFQESHNQPKASHPVSTPHSGGIRPSLQELEPQNLRSSLDSSDSSSDSEVEHIDEIYKTIIARMKMRKERWALEADMLRELDKDDELCINSICALYRQRIQSKISSFGIIPAYDISRITQLALLLIDGDPQQRLKKTVSELMRSDLDDCQKFAKKYSAQLFYIYKKKNDPFFAPPGN